MAQSDVAVAGTEKDVITVVGGRLEPDELAALVVVLWLVTRQRARRAPVDRRRKGWLRPPFVGPRSWRPVAWNTPATTPQTR